MRYNNDYVQAHDSFTLHKCYYSSHREQIKQLLKSSSKPAQHPEFYQNQVNTVWYLKDSMSICKFDIKKFHVTYHLSRICHVHKITTFPPKHTAPQAPNVRCTCHAVECSHHQTSGEMTAFSGLPHATLMSILVCCTAHHTTCIILCPTAEYRPLWNPPMSHIYLYFMHFPALCPSAIQKSWTKNKDMSICST